jgi:hypothetical protein
LKEDSHIFDVWARVHCDDIAMLDTQVMSHNTIHSSASIVKIVIGQNDQDSILPLLALHEHCVSSEQLESIHCVVRKGNNRVVIVGGIGNTIATCQKEAGQRGRVAYIKEFGFFFFLRMAVDVSSSFGAVSGLVRRMIVELSIIPLSSQCQRRR